MKVPTEYLWTDHFIFSSFSGCTILFDFNLSSVIIGETLIGAPGSSYCIFSTPNALIFSRKNLKVKQTLSGAPAESSQALQTGNVFYLCCKPENLTGKSHYFKRLSGTVILADISKKWHCYFDWHQRKVIFRLYIKHQHLTRLRTSSFMFSHVKGFHWGVFQLHAIWETLDTLPVRTKLQKVYA